MCIIETHPGLAAEWHPVKNNIDIKKITFGSNLKVWWKCPVAEDHEWQATVNNRTNAKSGCPYCKHPCKKVSTSNCLAKTHPTVASLWHPVKNGILTPHQVTSGSNRKVWWKCPVAEDHEWQAPISSMRGLTLGCSCCVGRTVVNSNCLQATHPKLASEWHSTKNSDLTPYKVTAGSHKKVWWKCPVAEDHEWQATVNNRSSLEVGCICCAGFKIVPSNSILLLYPDLAAEWHPTKNKVGPDKVGIASRRFGKIWWLGKCGHEWTSFICDRIRGNCCPICGFSKGEKMIKDYLDEKSIFYEYQYRFKNCRFKLSLPFDFFIKDSKQAIEYHGIQHFEYIKFFHKRKKDFIAMKKRDKLKEQWCKNNNIALLIIPYNDPAPKILLDGFIKRGSCLSP